jgi:hypothetical protein
MAATRLEKPIAIAFGTCLEIANPADALQVAAAPREELEATADVGAADSEGAAAETELPALEACSCKAVGRTALQITVSVIIDQALSVVMGVLQGKLWCKSYFQTRPRCLLW